MGWRVRSSAIAAALCGAVIAASVAAGAQDDAGREDGPAISFKAPREATAGTWVLARGRITGLDSRATVRAQLLSAGRWRTVSRRAADPGPFQIQLQLPAEGSAATLRGIVFLGGERVATSTRSRVRLLPATPLTEAPVPPAPPSPPAGGAASSTSPPPPAGPSDPGSPPEAEPEPEVEAPGGPIKATPSIYWGGWIDPGTPEQPAPINQAAIGQFEAVAGKRPSILESYSAFFQCADGSGGACSGEYAFPLQQLEGIRQRGAIPLFTWAPESSSGQVTQTNFELTDIANGQWDTYITKWAEAARDWGHPFFLRFGWEMNGNWFPWGKGVNGNEEADYVAAWQHVHSIFTAVGAGNAAWTWCPFTGPRPVSGFYPGDEYVDWTCLDGYNNTLTTAWRSFKQIFTPAYKEITETIAPGKPMLIAETASSEAGAPAGSSKAQWIEAMLAGLPTEFPAVRGLLWFNYEEGGKGWPLTTSAATEDAFAAGIANPLYLAGSSSGPLALP